MVQALLANRAHEPFRVGIGIRHLDVPRGGPGMRPFTSRLGHRSGRDGPQEPIDGIGEPPRCQRHERRIGTPRRVYDLHPPALEIQHEQRVVVISSQDVHTSVVKKSPRQSQTSTSGQSVAGTNTGSCLASRGSRPVSKPGGRVAGLSPRGSSAGRQSTGHAVNRQSRQNAAFAVDCAVKWRQDARRASASAWRNEIALILHGQRWARPP